MVSPRETEVNLFILTTK